MRPLGGPNLYIKRNILMEIHTQWKMYDEAWKVGLFKDTGDDLTQPQERQALPTLDSVLLPLGL